MFEYYLIYFILPLAITLWVQMGVKNAYAKYSRVASERGLTGYDTARRILDSNGLSHVQVEQVRGQMTDHYDPRANVIRLSEGVYASNSIAACGIAAHEAGHALQYAQGYAPIKLRASVIKGANIGSQMAMPLFFLGLLFALPGLCWAGIIAFSAAVLFQLITLPVEFNASRRAVECIEKFRPSDEELRGVKKMLSAAAMTYVASLAVSLLSLLRLITIVQGGSRRR